MSQTIIQTYLDKINFDGWMIGKEMVEKLLETVPVGSTILEIGGGVGTGVLRAFYDVITIENDPDYTGFNSEVMLCNMKDGWYDIDTIPYYDAIIIDGPKRPYNRQDFVKHIDKFDLSKPVFVDDTHKPKGRENVRAIEEKVGRKSQSFKSGRKAFCLI